MSLLQKWSPFGTSRWDPLKELEEMQERMRNVIGLTPLRGQNGKEFMSVYDWAPAVDVTEDDKEFLIKAELPEVKRADVKVSVDNGVLTITGERKSEHEEKTKKQHRIERSYGRFERSFAVPDEVDGSRVNAEFKDGVLNVHLPKNPNARPKSIDIKVG
jgi:HSP20 family protein